MPTCISKSLLLLFAVVFSAAILQSSEPYNVLRFAKWHFSEDFGKGIPAWMSYPLAQDVGYDPSIYISKEAGRVALVRDVIAHGERWLRFGMIRPLCFRATPSSTFQFEYRLEPNGEVEKVAFTLNSKAGRQYTALLPVQKGYQKIQLAGQSFGLAEHGDDIEVVNIEAVIKYPALGSHNRLTLFSFQVQGESILSLPLSLPHLIDSNGQIAVANEIVTRGLPLRIRLSKQREAVLTLYDPSGNKVLKSAFKGAIDYAINPMVPGLWSAKVQSEGAQTEFRFLVLGSIPPHPRILLSAQRIEQLKGNAVLRNLIHRRAQQLAASVRLNPWAGENIEHLSLISLLAGLPQYFAVLENYSNAASLGALDYVLNQNQSSLRLAQKILLQVSTWPTWTPPWFAAHGLHTYYETGIFTQRLAFTYDLIAQRFDQAEKLQLARALLHNSIEPVIDEYFVNDRLPIAASNHMAHSVGGAIAACVAMEGDIPDWTENFAPKLAELIFTYELLLHGLFPGDGSEAEPAGYENFAMQGMSWGASALASLHIRPRGIQTMLDAFWWERYIRIRANLVLDTGDFGDALGALTGFAWGAQYSHDPSLRAFYETGSDTSLIGLFRLEHTGRALESAPGLLDLVCCTGPLLTAPIPPPSHVFPLRGSAVLRSGWQEHDTVISLRAGPWFNHEHHDQGSFQVAAFGEKLIDEAGYTDYYKDPQYLNYFTQVPAHNTIMIDNDPFSQGDYDGRYWSALHRYPTILRHVFSKNIDYLIADLAPAYKVHLDNLIRDYLFLKPTLLIVRDRICSGSTPHQYTWILHAPPNSAINLAGDRAMITTGKAAALISTDKGIWTLTPQPIPIIAYDEFEHSKILSRFALELNTPPLTNHTFIVGIEFASLPTQLSPIYWNTSPDGTGFSLLTTNMTYYVRLRFVGAQQLRVANISTDGDMLAIVKSTGDQDCAATQAHTINISNTFVLNSSSPIDVVISVLRDIAVVHLDTDSMIDLSLSLPEKPLQVQLDGARPEGAFNRNLVFLHLTQGGHTVSIQY